MPERNVNSSSCNLISHTHTLTTTHTHARAHTHQSDSQLNTNCSFISSLTFFCPLCQAAGNKTKPLSRSSDHEQADQASTDEWRRQRTGRAVTVTEAKRRPCVERWGRWGEEGQRREGGRGRAVVVVVVVVVAAAS